MRDPDEALLERALEASAVEPSVPEGFADEVVRRAFPAARDRSRRFVGLAAAAAVLVAVGGGAAGHANRRVRGELATAAERGPTEARLGARAVAVIEPGSALRYEVGGLFATEPDVVWLDRGEAFLRVEPGRAFEVRTPAGRVRVTGTCFRVALGPQQETDMRNGPMVRAGFFGLGAVSAAMVVMVYEGSVAVSQDGDEETDVAAGQTVAVDEAGRIRRLDPVRDAVSADPGRGGPPTAPPVVGAVSSPEARARLEAEVARLAEILARHGISPDSGERARRGIEDDGNTDLTAEEWRTLAERGELRFKLPGQRDHGISDEVADAQGLAPDDRLRLDEIVAGEHEALEGDLRGLYAEASGLDPAGMSLRGMMSEIEDKTPAATAARIRWMLAQERAGLQSAPEPTEEMLPYERMMRRLVSFEGRLESALAAEVGPEQAHALIHGEPAMNAHAFGTTGRP